LRRDRPSGKTNRPGNDAPICRATGESAGLKQTHPVAVSYPQQEKKILFREALSHRHHLP
jgi:hypothetical protein